MFNIITEERKTFRDWDCFYGAYWLRLIWVQKPTLFPLDVVLQASVPAVVANLPMERDEDVVIQPQTEQPHESSGQVSTPPEDEYRMTGCTDSQQADDWGNGDVARVSAGDVNLDNNLPHLLGGLRTSSTTSPQAGSAGEEYIHCPHCDQEDETINHLLTSCVFAWQFWFTFLHRFGLAVLDPQPKDACFDDWW